ncbi:MAG TPA: sulfurtransferase TusA family protein [Polyangiaceae bacterium]|nr:sulfurtransferase TusA family protein [Polyangiaceae bacterium]
MSNLDARGKSCPLPIVLTAKAMRQIPVGEELVVQADDRAFLPDIEAWCKKTGHSLVRSANRDGYFEAVVRRTA